MEACFLWILITWNYVKSISDQPGVLFHCVVHANGCVDGQACCGDLRRYQCACHI